MYYKNNQRYPTVNEHCIKGFFQEYRFLSNFHILKNAIILDGIEYFTSEHAYMSCKTNDIRIKLQISKLNTPAEAKKLGKTIQLIEGWDDLKYNFMHEICTQKFRKNEDIKQMLLSTGEKYLEETNNWNDRYWGVCDNIGYNNLGNILMNIRDELKNEHSK